MGTTQVPGGLVLAIDAGTTGVTALVVRSDTSVAARGYAAFAQHFPHPGWVEHAPEEIWQAVLQASRDALGALAPADGSPAAVGVTNQRETAVLWDRQTLAAPCRAIVWQDRRTAALCVSLTQAGHAPLVEQVTGLRLDPYFTATKLAWLAANAPAAWDGVRAGRVAVGTVDSYLLARLTAGRLHATDASNASRTLLWDLAEGRWSGEMCALFGVPESALPRVLPSWGTFGRTDPAAFLGLDLPVCGLAGDQQAALFGQACFTANAAKCTYGTGSFILVNTGGRIVRAGNGLLPTLAWTAPTGEVTYALEGSIFVTGAAVQWLRDGLGIIGDAAETEALARTVPDSGGVVFVPALTGLGAPDWDPDARGMIVGITRGTTRAHLVRATLEAIAHEVRDVVDLLAQCGVAPSVLRADGGAAGNDFLLQEQADQLAITVERPAELQTTALGAAFLAGLGARVWSSTDEVTAAWCLGRRFEPHPRPSADAAHRRWRSAVTRAKGWAAEPER